MLLTLKSGVPHRRQQQAQYASTMEGRKYQLDIQPKYKVTPAQKVLQRR